MWTKQNSNLEPIKLRPNGIFGFKGAPTSQVIGARNEMVMDDYDGEMRFGDLVGLKLPDIRLTGEEKPRKNLTQETCPDRGSNPVPLRDKRACYHLFHSGGLLNLSLPLCHWAIHPQELVSLCCVNQWNRPPSVFFSSEPRSLRSWTWQFTPE